MQTWIKLYKMVIHEKTLFAMLDSDLHFNIIDTYLKIMFEFIIHLLHK